MTTIADTVGFSSRDFPSNWSLPDDLTGRILVGGFHAAKDECYYVIDFDRRVVENCTINIAGYVGEMSAYLKRHVALENLPYGSPSHDAAVFNFVQPHEGLALRDGRIVIAMHNASYAREIDFGQRHVSQFSEESKFAPRMLSATHSLDGAGEHLYYAVTDMDQRMQMYEGRRTELDTGVFCVDINWKAPQLLSRLKTKEVAHEVKCCPGDRLVAVTEFCLIARGSIPQYRPDVFEEYSVWEDYERQGLHSSNLYLVDKTTGSTTSAIVNDQTPGHIEFSLSRPDRFYLSSHNLSKLHGKLILHGTGCLVTGAVGTDGIKLDGVFRDERFFRVTSHKVFRYDDRDYVAVTVYPDRFYVLSEPDLEVIHDVRLYDHPPITLGRLHFCTLLPHMPLWIETSDNGRYVILVSNEYFYVYDLQTRRLDSFHGFSFNGQFMGTAHTTNLNNFPRS